MIDSEFTLSDGEQNAFLADRDVRSETYRRLLIAFFAVFAVTMVVFLVSR